MEDRQYPGESEEALEIGGRRGDDDDSQQGVGAEFTASSLWRFTPHHLIGISLTRGGQIRDSKSATLTIIY
jgi:hypothetical protein